MENQTTVEMPETTVGTPLITSENCDENDATNSRPASTKFPLLTPTESVTWLIAVILFKV